MLLFILIACLTMVLSSPQTPDNPEINSSYSSVIKDSPDQPQLQNAPKPIITVPGNFLSDEDSLKITTESSTEGVPNTNSVRRRVDHSWLDLTNVSKKSDHVNSTAKALQYLKELNASANQRIKNISREEPYLCSETFGDEEFFIRSPNYPFNYPAYTNCKFTVKRLNKSICGIIFTVLRFDIEPTGSSDSEVGICSGDKLSIGNQVICGRMRRGTESFNRFTSSTFNLTFTSGKGFGASGFLIKGKQTSYCLPEKPLTPPLQSSVSCDRIITEEVFNLTSPSYPDIYPSDVECHYEVLQSNWNICGLLLTPSHFDVEGASYCMFDYVEIQGKRLCGNLTLKEQYYYMFETDKIDIRFRSDESVSKVGFNLKGKQVLCNELEFFQPIHSPLVATESLRENKADEDLHNFEDIGEILTLIAKSGLPIDSTEEPSVRDPKSIVANEETTTDSEFLSLDSSEKNTIDNKFLSLSSNEKESEVLETSQTTKQSNFQNESQLEYDDDVHKDDDELNSPPVYFPIPNKFTRDSPIQKDLLSSNTCDERHSEQVFFIQSVNYPDNYTDNLNCAYYIYRSTPDVCQLRLTLEDINIEKSSSAPEDCGDDYLDIAGYKICGSFQKTVLNIAFTGENVIIRFKSNSENTDKGYLITVEQIDKECASRGRKTQDLACDSVIRYDNFTVYSPGYPHWYPRNMWCTTTIYKTNPSIRSLEVFFQEFDLESSPQCERDFLSIGERRFCGEKSGNSYIFPFEEDSIQLTLATNEDISSNGFRIYMKQVSDLVSREPERSPQCGGEYYSSVSVLTSPQFPSDYEADLNCVYSIFRKSSDICQLQIKIIDFDVEPSPGCRKDYLQLGLRRLCGQNYVNEIHNYHFSSDKFNVMFHSDLQGSGKGFRIEVTQRSCLNPIDNELQTPPPIITAPPTFARPDPSKEIEFPPLFPQTHRPIYPTHRPIYPTHQKPFPAPGGRFPIKYDHNCMKDFRVIGNINYKPHTHPRPSKVVWPTPCVGCSKLYPYNYNHGYNYYNTYKTVPTSSVHLKPNPIYSHSSNKISTNQISNGRRPITPGTYYYNNWQSHPQVYRLSYGRSISGKNRTFDNIPKDPFFITDTNTHGLSEQLNENKILDFLNRNNNSKQTRSEPIESSFKLPGNLLSNSEGIESSFKLPGNPHSNSEGIESSFKLPGNPHSNSEGIGNSFKLPGNPHSNSVGIGNSFKLPGNPHSNSEGIGNSFKLPGNTLSNSEGIGNSFKLPDNSLSNSRAIKTNFKLPSNPFSNSETIESSFKLPTSTLQLQTSPQNLSPQIYFPPIVNPTNPFVSGNNFLSGRFNPSKAGPIMIVKEVPSFSKGNSDKNHLLSLQNETPDFSQSVNLCNRSISLETFEMKSPGYPGPFYPNMNCYYMIYRNDVSRCGLLLNIDMLDLPGSPPCQDSYLSISGRRFCGSKENGITVVVPFSRSSPIAVEYRSNTFHSGGGFSLKAKQVPCNFTLGSGRSVFHSQNFENFIDAVSSQSQNFETVVRPEPQRVNGFRSQNFLYDLSEDEKFLNADFKPSYPQPVAREYLSVPWVGARSTKHPPYRTGLELVGVVKG